MKNKLKEESERNEELVDEIGKLKKKMKDTKNEANDEVDAKKEVIFCQMEYKVEFSLIGLMKL